MIGFGDVVAAAQVVLNLCHRIRSSTQRDRALSALDHEVEILSKSLEETETMISRHQNNCDDGSRNTVKRFDSLVPTLTSIWDELEQLRVSMEKVEDFRKIEGETHEWKKRVQGTEHLLLQAVS
jgi:predicted  nucleic acid-binding Zn-ribbon protein